MPRPTGNPPFLTTRWSVVLSAQGAPAGEARAALAELCEAYWYPLYAFLRRSGHDEANAMDLVQGFLTGLLDGGSLQAEPGRGRFRSYLLGALKHYVANEVRAVGAAKRGGGALFISLDAVAAEERYAVEPADPRTPEDRFEREWAVALLERSLTRLEGEYAERGRAHVFSALRPLLVGAGASVPYAELARDLGKSEGVIKVTVHRMRARMAELVRHEVLQTVGESSEVEGEVGSLFAALARAPLDAAGGAPGESRDST